MIKYAFTTKKKLDKTPACSEDLKIVDKYSDRDMRYRRTNP